MMKLEHKLSSLVDIYAVSDDALRMQSDEIDSEISIGTEIPEHEPNDDVQNEHDVFASFSELHVDNDDNGKLNHLILQFSGIIVVNLLMLLI